ncbi:UDP-N-acetylmuramoyl-L-alanine--D-glutamate ligase [Lentibacillus sp. CBA3610]|uniref:UDP-N-acetylmuramoyl-L-alanine--D-glutamate ligase n=1 Tax=Lentibacillus sp. CBA3610 TaxID=2518176 RepID=UPI001596258F|nr:UDP-N-acetylmuramoyl-L-alanine--D-glutamate ligase [Lentibacillus sp. CBA3610]QKY68960.1 UDP-N-acetylmuramoyl-L-alanine--D-glutamate ligase [Lentibacillus sp. CBA3610]
MKELTNFPYSHVLVLGLAKSGTAAARLLLQNGKNVRVNDQNADETDAIVDELKSMGAEVITGSHPISVLDGVEIIIKNPGIPYDTPLLQEACKRDIPMITEIELAGNLSETATIGITGSNGKTTTTTLTAEMLKESSEPVKVAGNIGYVATEVAQTLEKNEKMVLELSSFQLMGVKRFKPKIAVLLNIFHAHLDYHKTFENYKNAKCNIFANQTADDFLIYNADDKTVREAVTSARSVKIPFSLRKRVENGAWADDTSIYFKNEKLMDKQDIVLAGDHNLENVLASICAAKLSGASNQAIHNVLTTFAGVRHRLQFVNRINDRLFYNDSKATNILATQKALSSFKQPVILLAGGLDRGNEFDDLKPFLKNVKGIILIGETKDKMSRVAREAAIPFIERAENMEDAVEQAYNLSERHDVVLLSPACASWDQYQTFEERGNMFIQAVHTLL